MKAFSVTVALLLPLVGVIKFAKSEINLPDEQIPYYFRNYPDVAQECLQDPKCSHKRHAKKDVCWGYEDDCSLEPKSYSHPICSEDHQGWVKSKDEQIQTFYKQADFGYIKNVRNSLSLLCEPTYREDSSLECSESMTFCRARNIWIDFRDLVKREKPVMYDTDVLKQGQIGGYCKLIEKNLKSAMGPISSLQSWTPEIQHFVPLESRPMEANSSLCDVIVKRPTFIMKIDATVSYYHHFCDFVNLYMSLHVNATANFNNPFTRNVNILIWRTYDYQSNFGVVFNAFTQHRLLSLNDFKGKRVCFKNAVFPLLPRMIFGLYYNTPLIWGCQNSGMFHAFSNFILQRLGINRRLTPGAGPLNVTFLSRQTKYRKVLNEDALIRELRENPNFNVQHAKFTWSTPFKEQLQVIQNTDILIGMHGAGLTHMLFLPDWAAVFELYNCEDEHCYADLARLRGLKYLTWEDQSKLKEEGKDPQIKGAYAKHTNYIFDPPEFIRIVTKAEDYVNAEVKKRIHPKVHDEL